MDASRESSWHNFKKQIKFYVPAFSYYKNPHFKSSPKCFPSISVTGDSCALGCEHCQGRLLRTMIPARSPTELFKVCEKLKADGCIGCLVSGGCLSDGSVPLNRFTDTLSQVTRELGLKIVVHTGLIDGKTAQKLKRAGIDAALIDIIGSNETIREIYHLDAGTGDYEESLEALHAAGIPIVPHILVGLHYGKILGEFDAIDMVAKHTPSALVIIALTPIRGTEMAGTTPPKPEEIAKVIVAARLRLPRVPIALGCVRPLGMHRAKTDILALKAGVNAIAYPSEVAIKMAKSMGLKTSFYPICCSQIYEDI